MEQSNILNFPPAALRDNHAAIKRVLLEHQDALQYFLRVRLGNEQDRQEVAQDLFVRLCQIGDLSEKLSYGTESTRSYLFKIATNLICDMKRREASRLRDRHCEFDDTVHATDRLTPEVRVQQRQELALVKKGILKLNRKCQQAFVMSRFFDMSYRDISEEMGVSCSMVEKYISQALVELRRLVGSG